eukprot:CAMPEP_0113670962 /NCGR_PEP_ID=MMETSP0038_2-20120614/5439_1 /TAXON_ID=2898 /ORGANISM="Cryptomonas paramecium" /LENGTH=122 /DNA_ID=CAMNT_0000587059 /DNA_START=1 /DNA_END=366 /DNA_ORIENTATION=- /assembly_acc=CAM_ASM_000170
MGFTSRTNDKGMQVSKERKRERDHEGSGDRMVRSRSVLTAKQVIEIFELSSADKHISAYKVAPRFGISEKTVRDIWSGRTWGHITMAQHTMTTGSSSSSRHVCQFKVDDSSAKTIDDLLFEW